MQFVIPVCYCRQESAFGSKFDCFQYAIHYAQCFTLSYYTIHLVFIRALDFTKTVFRFRQLLKHIPISLQVPKMYISSAFNHKKKTDPHESYDTDNYDNFRQFAVILRTSKS